MATQIKPSEAGHHLILGKLTDFLTGEVLDDTLDERYRQKIARLLVNTKGYRKGEIVPRYPLGVVVDDKKALVPIDFLIRRNNAFTVLIKFGPGSLVTRHQPALAAARMISKVQIPLVIITNGVTAHTLETGSDRLLFEGLEKIPDRQWVRDYVAHNPSRPVSAKAKEMAARIVYCYEVDGACPCDTTVCRLE